MASKKPEKEEKKPWVKWYWSDWKADETLRACSLTARGLWAEMLAIMDKADPYGHLLINGKPTTARQLANQAGGGVTEEHVIDLLKELEEAGVFSKTRNDIIYSRRMVRDKEKAVQNTANGLKGGNPKLKRGVQVTDNRTLQPPGSQGGYPTGQPKSAEGDKAQRPEARGHMPEARKKEASDLRDNLVEKLGLDEQRCLVIGPIYRWLEAGYSADEILAVGERCKPKLSGGNPLGYLDKAMDDQVSRLRRETGSEQLSDDLQRSMCLTYYATGKLDPATGKAGEPWVAKETGKRSWAFDGAPPLRDGSMIKDAIAFTVIGELGLSIDDEIERASR